MPPYASYDHDGSNRVFQLQVLPFGPVEKNILLTVSNNSWTSGAYSQALKDAMDGATAYCTHQPCVLCAKILLNSGVVDIVYREPYPAPLSEELLAEAGVIPRQLIAVVMDEPLLPPEEAVL